MGMVRVRTKACDCCQEASLVLYRVQYDASGLWRFVCDRCYRSVSHQNPHYVYGGTWKARKR